MNSTAMLCAGGQLPCHPMYHQGAFYLLGRELVDYLDASSQDLQLLSNEDAMVGLWLLGVRKRLLNIGGDFYCGCSKAPKPANAQAVKPFYHSCKTQAKIDTCMQEFGEC
jgi:Galactosyltransferase